jgi:nitrogen fixation protein NifU and related proteins
MSALSGSSDLDELYQATIVEHDRAPHNQGSLTDATHRATVDNPLCGDVVSVHVRVDGERIRDIACDGRGCALSRASTSILSTMVRDRSLAEVRQLAAAFEQMVQSPPEAAIDAAAARELGELVTFVGVRRFRSRRVCALLPFRALMQALDSS